MKSKSYISVISSVALLFTLSITAHAQSTLVYSVKQSGKIVTYCKNQRAIIESGGMNIKKVFTSNLSLITLEKQKLAKLKARAPRTTKIKTAIAKSTTVIKNLTLKRKNHNALCLKYKSVKPTPTPTKAPSTGNKYGIPSNLTGVENTGKTIHAAKCVGCHTEKQNRTYSQIAASMSGIPQMAGLNVSNQDIAHLTMYLNRYNN